MIELTAKAEWKNAKDGTVGGQSLWLRRVGSSRLKVLIGHVHWRVGVGHERSGWIGVAKVNQGIPIQESLEAAKAAVEAALRGEG